jgi:uracil-DNA glycosylase
LLADIRRCTVCAKQLPQAPKPIFQFSPHARILVASQAPGRRAHASGIPVDDPSGDRLRRWMGLDRDAFYDPKLVAIVPMGFCYPGTGKSGDLPPRSECAPQWRTQLLAKLTALELTLLIGEYAQSWHLRSTPRGSLTQTVVAWRDHWPAALPLPHPSPRNNLWMKTHPWFESDVIPILQERIQRIRMSAE